jgi:zinc/manganese transport system substrate-binding protein
VAGLGGLAGPAALTLGLAVAVAFCGCGAADPFAGAGRQVRVVAAENFWGSIAAQLGGDRVRVRSVVVNPAADPHAYEPTPADARAMAAAQLVIVNGIGYDPWAPALLRASPSDGRRMLTVGDVVGLKAGGNPHQWYSPAVVGHVIDRITAEYQRLDPRDQRYFSRLHAAFEDTALRRYRGLIATIRRRYAGVSVGASESIFAPLAAALGLRLITAPGFLKAVSEGTDISAADKAAADHQIRTRQIRVWVYNRQNATPDVMRLTQEATAAGIPVTTVTETLDPASASFQDWQVAQLQNLRTQLAKASRP